MTRIPFPEQHEIIAIAYATAGSTPTQIGPYCARPGCTHTADERHHIVRRSFLGGTYDWIEYKGKTIQNVVGVCHNHHEELTQNKSMIEWDERKQTFVWREGDFLVGPLSTVGEVVDQFIYSEEEPIGPAAGTKCPTCRRVLPRPKEEKEQARVRRTWAITVPKDERENGAEVLDTLMNECRDIFGHDESKRVRYFTLVQALSLVVQNRSMLK